MKQRQREAEERLPLLLGQLNEARPMSLIRVRSVCAVGRRPAPRTTKRCACGVCVCAVLSGRGARPPLSIAHLPLVGLALLVGHDFNCRLHNGWRTVRLFRANFLLGRREKGEGDKKGGSARV